MLDRLSEGRIRLLIALAGIALFVPFLGVVHLFDWDEINFAEAAREMLVSGDWLRVQVDFQPFWEKPPLFIWMQALAMKALGVGEFAARLPNALVGVATLLALYVVGRREHDRAFGLLWAALYAASLLPALYFRSGIIDPAFNLAIFLAVIELHRWHQAKTSGSAGGGRRLLLAGLWSGVAVLTKGPVGWLLAALAWGAFWLARRGRMRFPLAPGLAFTALTAAVAALWFGLELAGHGTWFLSRFVAYQVRLLTTGDAAGHGLPFYYHFVVLLLGCFPASALLFAGLPAHAADTERQRDLKLWMVIVLCVVLVVFSAVRSKIVHYSSLAYFPVTFLAARALHRTLARGEPWRRHASVLLAALGALWGLLLAALPVLLRHKERWLPLVRDRFARGNLEAPVTWTYADALPGLALLAGTSVAVAAFARGRPRRGAAWLLATTTLAFTAVLPVLAPRVEAITQRAAVEFCRGLARRPCYVRALGFRSYTPYFYARERPEQGPSSRGMTYGEFEEWLLAGEIDRPAYFVCKVTDVQRYADHPGLAEVGRANGFVFLERRPVAAPGPR
jgi:4-amino-4-deoxy-L-arabinose transferase-like glycosyltransferase